uniref:microsomal epoxide hydrolase n=1 Tax=Plectus sambesii TaxID=2011161 RepID=A0A914WPN8_9BILA
MYWKSGLVLAAALYLGYFLSSKPDFAPPVIPEDEYFGEGQVHADDKALRKFEIKVSEEDIKDLKSRVKAGLNRHFKPLEDSRFHDGFNPDAMKQVAEYWLQHYDWKQHENYLNRFEHFKTEIEGVKIHYIRSTPVKSEYTTTIPILMVHGWPGSVWEFHKIIPMLSNPARYDLGKKFAFEVICPSLPGFGWSGTSSKKGLSYVATARIYAKLMQRLGFSSYYVQGGDWGSIVVTAMAALYPERITGLHNNMPFVASPTFAQVMVKHIVASFFPSLILDTEDIGRLKPIKQYFLDLLQETGYYHIQATKPNTI